MTLKLPLLGNMRAAYPCPLTRILTSDGPFGPKDLPIYLEQEIDEILLKAQVCHVLA